MSNAYHRIETLLFPASSDRWLGFLRMALGIQIMLYCWSLRHDWMVLFSTNANGMIRRDLPEAILNAESALIPRLGWLVETFGKLDLGEDFALWTTWLLLLVSGVLLLSGLFSRSAAISAWFLHLCAVKSGNLMAYGMDNFTTIGLFYLMFSPLPDRYALDHRMREVRLKDPHLVGFFRRVLQLHLCIIYFSSGVTKSLGAGWWNGTSMWRALTTPPFNMIPVDSLLMMSWLFPLVGIGVCLFELSYPFLIWRMQTRFVYLLVVIALHIAIAFSMGLYLFSLVMIVLNIAAFGIPLTRSREKIATGPIAAAA